MRFTARSTPLIRALILVLTSITFATPAAGLRAQGYEDVRFARFGGPEELKLMKHDKLPVPGKGQVRIKVQAASASFTDIMVRKGIYYEFKEPLPAAPGYDLVGVIDKVGPGVTKFKVGQRVADLTVWGAYTQYAIRPIQYLVPVPKSVDAGEAVTLVLAWTTAYQLLHREANVKPGQSILIHGAGGAVGSALAVLAKLQGLTVYGTASARKHEYVKSLGVIPIDYRKEDFVKRIQELTRGKGVAAAFDFVSLKNFERSFETLGDGGKLVMYGFYDKSMARSGGGMVGGFLRMQWKKFWWNTLPNGGRSASFYGITDLRKARPDWFRADLGKLFELLADRKIKPFIYKRMPLARAAEAHRLIEGRKVRGKIVLLPFPDKP